MIEMMELLAMAVQVLVFSSVAILLCYGGPYVSSER